MCVCVLGSVAGTEQPTSVYYDDPGWLGCGRVARLGRSRVARLVQGG